MTDVALEFVELGLRLGRHQEGLVDSYYGPAEIKERIDGEGLREPGSLAEDAARLRGSLDGIEDSRRTWFEAQLAGLETAARTLDGAELSFEEEVELYYGVPARRTPESELQAAHDAFDAVLPGSGPLEERYRAWREDDAIRADRLAEVISRMNAALRERATELVGLPEGEAVDYEYVSDKPWAAFNYYRGDLRSRVEVNLDAPSVPDLVVEWVAHETYPGHHTEHAWKEHLLTRAGQLEETIVLIPTPQSVVSEGIASIAAQIALGDGRPDFTASAIEGIGVRYDPEVSRGVMDAWGPLGGVGTNAALLLHEDGVSVDEAREYVMHWSLASEKRAEHVIAFINDPLWRSYVTTYPNGEKLAREFVDGDVGRFRRLLTEQLTPADLR
ncbi:MAG TPA: hypothetical protein VKC65_03615 [Gaiellaceae bacterium]|nr:hypothetical protein [Gaiellaceae bacterium]